jgi:hypothetical protein
MVSVSRSLPDAYPPRDCGKEKESSVKPLNIVGRLVRAQCLFIRQSARMTVEISHFNDRISLMHRVIHRSWGVPEEHGHESRFRQWKCLVFEGSGRFMRTQGDERQCVKYFFFRNDKIFSTL